MAILLLADHDTATLSDQTAKALTAAAQIGSDVHVLVAGSGAKDAADIGRDDDEVVIGESLLDVLHHHRLGIQIVGRDIEEALDLPGVEIDRKHPVGARLGDQVGDQLGRDRRAGGRLPVLPGIAEIGNHRRDPLGRGAAAGVDPDEQLHQVVVGRETGRLDDEQVLAAHVLVDLDENLLVGESPYAGVGERDFQIAGDRPRERQVRIAGHEFHRG